MITIVVTKNSIEATGHAEYGKHGEDIVCAAVSILMQTLELRGIASIKESGNMIVTTTNKQALELITDGLKLIADNCPSCVEVIEEHTWQETLSDVKRQEYEFGKSIGFKYMEVIE